VLMLVLARWGTHSTDIPQVYKLGDRISLSEDYPSPADSANHPPLVEVKRFR